MSEFTVPSGKGESTNCTQRRSLSTNFKIGLVLMGLAVASGAALNWNWLVAAGLLPIIVGLLPCAVMCGLHLCSANKGSNQSPGRRLPELDAASQEATR